jgi:hypothetical protein
MVGGLQIKIRCLRWDVMAALKVGNRATTVAKHAGRARSTGKKEDQLSRDNPCPMSSNRAQLCSLAWAEESWVTRSLEIVVRFAGASLCRGLFVSMKIAHNRVVRSGCDDGHLNLPVTAMSSCPVAGVATTSRERCPRWGARVAADRLARRRLRDQHLGHAEVSDLRARPTSGARSCREAVVSDGRRAAGSPLRTFRERTACAVLRSP